MNTAPASKTAGKFMSSEDVTPHTVTGSLIYRRSGAADCWTISFFEEVAVRAGSFKPKRSLIGCINQDPVGFNVAVA